MSKRRKIEKADEARAAVTAAKASGDGLANWARKNGIDGALYLFARRKDDEFDFRKLELHWQF